MRTPRTVRLAIGADFRQGLHGAGGPAGVQPVGVTGRVSGAQSLVRGDDEVGDGVTPPESRFTAPRGQARVCSCGRFSVEPGNRVVRTAPGAPACARKICAADGQRAPPADLGHFLLAGEPGPLAHRVARPSPRRAGRRRPAPRRSSRRSTPAAAGGGRARARSSRRGPMSRNQRPVSSPHQAPRSRLARRCAQPMTARFPSRRQVRGAAAEDEIGLPARRRRRT